MSTAATFATPVSYLFPEEYSLDVVGRWGQKGVVIIYRNAEYLDTLNLPMAEFNVTALLARAAIQSRRTFWSRAFLSASDLLRGITERTSIYGQAENAIAKYVCDLRKRIDDWLSGSGLGPSPGKRLVETHALGYRLSLRAENLRLILDGEEQGPND